MDKGAITGKVTNGHGKSVEDAIVLIIGNSPSHKDIAALTNEQGVYKFCDLIPGDYNIMVNAEGCITKTKQAHVEAGIVIHLDFSLFS